MEFRINDRKGSKQLSDQIIDSAEDLFDIYLSHDFVQKLLMNGEMSGANIDITFRHQKHAEDIGSAFGQMFVDMARLTDIKEEKQFFESYLSQFDKLMAENHKQLEQLCGKPDPKLMNGPITTPAYGYINMMLYHGATGPFLRIAVIALTGFLVCYQMGAYLKQNPNYKPNDLAKFISFEMFDFKLICDQFRVMIDRRGDQVSKEEVEELSELFKRAVVYEYALIKHEYSGAEWFDG